LYIGCRFYSSQHMKVIYTIKNPEENIAYVWYTWSFATRLSRHIANWLLIALQLPTTVPVFILIKTGKAIIDLFLVQWDYRQEEKDQISRMRLDWWNLINKTNWWNWR